MKRDESSPRVHLDEQPLDALRSMRTAVPVEAPEAVSARRERLVQGLESQIIAEAAARHRAARLRRVMGVAALVAGTASFVAMGVVLGEHVTAQRGASAAARPVDSSPVGRAASSEQGRDDASAQDGTARLVQASGAALRRPGQQRDERTLDVSNSAGLALAPGTALHTRAEGWLELELPSRARIEMSERSELSLDGVAALSQKLALVRGRIDVSVPKPQTSSPHRLVIVTPDSEVEVRGTVFSVEVRPSKLTPARLVTEVFVSRGAVAVRHAGRERLVTMGGHFTSEDAPSGREPGERAARTIGSLADSTERDVDAVRPPAQRDPTDASARTRDDRLGMDPDGPVRSSPGQPIGKHASTLGEQNRLFERAIAARDDGDFLGAVALLDELLARYPSSPLSNSARIERARILAKRGASPSTDH